MSKNVLIATVKPFAPAAAEATEAALKAKGYPVKRLEKYGSQEELQKAVAEAEALIVRSDKIDADVLAAAPNLKVVARAGSGYDTIDCATAKERGVVVMNTPGQNANAVGELVMAMMVYMARNQFNGKPGTELLGKTLGLLGFGAVGKAVGRIAKGFGMELVSLDPCVDAATMEAQGACYTCEPNDIYAKADYVSLHIPATKENLCCIGYDVLMSMKKGACLVNAARKEIIDEEGMVRAFTERDDLKYASDIAPDNKAVFEEKFPGRFFFTPKKMGAQTAEANVNAGVAAATQIMAYFEEGDTTFQVNK
jgi:D-3-phosphoglycerate dehydrogenase